ncbi:hypothetical protein GQ457_06G020130 [Hibiscus cannabinus]
MSDWWPLDQDLWTDGLDRATWRHRSGPSGEWKTAGRLGFTGELISCAWELERRGICASPNKLFRGYLIHLEWWSGS